MKKKTTTLRFEIPDPCAQQWPDMPSLPGGRFCQRCEHTVVDFTQMTDSELVRYFRRHQGRVCGIFRNDQLERELPVPHPPTPLSKWKAIGTLVSGLLLAAGGWAQEAAVAKVTPFQLVDQGPEVPKVEDADSKISGYVTDGSGEPLIGASVYAAGHNLGTSTDGEGYYELTVPGHVDKLQLTYSYIGYTTLTLGVDLRAHPRGPIPVRLKQVATNLDEAVVTANKRLLYKCTTTGLVCRRSTGSQEKEQQDYKTPDETLPDIHLFPNPFTDFIQVKIEVQKEDTFLFHLYNAVGQLVFAESRRLPAGPSQSTFDLQAKDLSAGIYFLRVSGSRGELRTKKMIRAAL